MQAMAAESPATPADSAAFCGGEFKNSLFRIHTLKTSSQPDAQRLFKSFLARKNHALGGSTSSLWARKLMESFLVSRLSFRHLRDGRGPTPQQVIGYAKGLRGNGEGRIYGGRRWEKRAINY